jgi:hypothetical protein
MGTMTLADYRTELAFLLKGRDDIGNAQFDRAVNHAYSHLCQPEVRKHKEMEERYDITLVSGTNEYSLSAATVGNTVLGVKDVTYYDATSITATATKRDVHPENVNWFNKRTIPSGGWPSKYAEDGELLLIYPVPGSNEANNMLRVTYWREPAVLSNDSDTTALGNYWDFVLKRGAQWILEYDIGLRELSVLTRQEYVALINEKSDSGELNADDDSFKSEFKSESSMPSG